MSYDSLIGAPSWFIHVQFQIHAKFQSTIKQQW